MAKLTLTDITGGYASVAGLNGLFALIETAMENTLSRDGTTPNQMSADIDLNSNDLLNVGRLDAGTLFVNGIAVAPANLGFTTSDQVNHTPAGTGTTVTTVEERFNQVVNAKDFGAVGDNVADDTLAIQAALDYAESLNPSGKFYLPAGNYSVSQIIIGKSGIASGGTYDFNNANIIGNATTPTKSIVDLKQGQCFIYNLKIAGNSNENYECGLHWYTNDLGTYYPGLVRLKSLQVDGCVIGVCVGALPSQADPIPAQGTVQAEGIATDAPISESYIDDIKCVDCIKDFYMRQPNGKLSIMNPTFSSRNSAWPGTGVSAEINVLPLVVIRSELSIFGGSLENISDSAGFLANITDASFSMDGTVVESKSPFYIAGTARVDISNTKNWGLNNDATSFFWIDDGAENYLNLSDMFLFRGFGTASTQPVVKVVSNLAGSFGVNPEFWVNMARVQLTNPNFLQGAVYNPVTYGCRTHYDNCAIQTYASNGTRLAVYKLHEETNKLNGLVDLSADTITAFGVNPSATSGGWVFDNASGSNSWGKSTDVPIIEGVVLTSSLRLLADAAASIFATTPKFDVTPQKMLLFKGWMKTEAVGTQNIFRIRWYKFDGTAASVTETNMLNGAGGANGPGGTIWSPFELWAQAPADATQADLFIYSETSSGFYLANAQVTESI